MPDLTIAGAGMAGLTAAARARQLGLDVRVVEKGDRLGGSMALSSGAIWRYRTFEQFTEECPDGERTLQELVFERLDGALEWLESLGIEPVAREWGNERLVGVRFDPGRIVSGLVEAADVQPELRTAIPEQPDGPLLLATGGFHASPELLRDDLFVLRGNRWSTGDGLRAGLAHEAAVSAGLDQFYCRAMPAPPARVPEAAYQAASLLFGRWALVLDDAGAVIESDESDWSEVRLAQAIGRRPGARAWYVADSGTLEREVLGRPVSEMVKAAARFGGEVRTGDKLSDLGLGELPVSDRLKKPPYTAVRVAVGVTHTIGGLHIDNRARVLDLHGQPVAGLLAAGADAGGVATGGYASGLAQALVLGLTAAETAAGAS